MRDEILDEYKKKRNFKITPEPDGSGVKNKSNDKIANNFDTSISLDSSVSHPRFVVQRHEASRLHYDFRLESLKENVLLSWAVPKGLSLDPSVKRLAIQTEDHPVSYLLFEGVIPKGNYGAGTVIVWDTGRYSLQIPNSSGTNTKENVSDISIKEEDVADTIRKEDKISFVLYGQKVIGRFSLIRTKNKEQWLLIKSKDEYACEPAKLEKNNRERNLTDSKPYSVLTGKTNKDLLIQKSLTLENSSSNEKKINFVNTNASTKKINSNKQNIPNNSNLGSYKNIAESSSLKQVYLEASKPMLSFPKERPFDSKDWVFEIKWDGVRAISLVNKQLQSCIIISRSGDTITFRYPELQNALSSALNNELFKDYVILDGEIVVLDKKGYPNFQNHQKRMNIDSLKSIETLSRQYPATYFIFDILYLDDNSLKELPFLKRREKLSSLIKKDNDKIRLSDFVEEFGTDTFETAKKMNLEGIVAKKKSSKYYSGIRSKEWFKIKNVKTQDCVIIGFTRGEGNRQGYFGSLLLAALDNSITTKSNEIIEGYSMFKFIGHTGSGFNSHDLLTIKNKLNEIPISQVPIINVPYLNRETTWVKPTIVVEVKFNGWTNSKIMRAPIFQRIRSDKPPLECIIEADQGKDESNKRIDEVEGKSENSLQSIRKANDDSEDHISNKNSEKPISKFSNLKKEFWTATTSHPSITKGDLIDYYDKISDILLPYLQDRPLSLSRYPNGIYGKAFYQKDWKSEKPSFVRTIKVYSESSNKEINYLVCNNKETLLWLINLGCIEIHPWTSKINDYNQCDRKDQLEKKQCGLNYPDFIVFDLDPYLNYEHVDKLGDPDYDLKAFKETVAIAYNLKDIFDDLNIKSFVKTSGKTGLHIFLPVINLYTYDQTREFSKIISQILKKRIPGKTTTEWKTSERRGKVFFDFNQNSIGKTLASVFSVRPVESASVSVPISWEELSEITPTDYTLLNVPEIYKKKVNPWKDIFSFRQNLEEILGNAFDSNIRE